MFTENAMPKIWFTVLPRAIFLRLVSLEIDRGFRLRAQRKLLRQNIWKCQVANWGQISQLRCGEVSWGILKWAAPWIDRGHLAFFFKLARQLHHKMPSGNFRGFVPGDNDRGCSASHRSLSAPVYVLDCVCHLLLTRISRRSSQISAFNDRVGFTLFPIVTHFCYQRDCYVSYIVVKPCPINRT